MKIRAYQDVDWSDWLRMSQLLFPHDSTEGLTGDMRKFRARSDAEVFVAERADGSLAGFVEVGTRPYADGCDTSPVGYIEAWYVDAGVRRSGYGRALLTAAEEWARGRGYGEIASDALLDNEVSHAAHRRAGYEEVGRVVQFRKSLLGLALLFLTLVSLDNRLDAQRVIPAGITSIQHARVGGQNSVTLTLVSVDTTDASARASSHAAAWGAGIGTIIGGAYGFALGYGGCDSAGSHGTCITQATVGGALICAIAGYGIGWLIGTSRR